MDKDILLLKPVYNKGRRDFYRGNLDNPFDNTTLKGKEWQRGFNYAYQENKSRRRGKEVQQTKSCQ